MKINIRNELENKLMKSLNELDKRFDTIYNDLEQKLSKGVEESVNSCVTSTKELITDVSLIQILWIINHHFLALLTSFFVTLNLNGQTCFKTLEALCKKSGCHFPKNMNEFLDLNKTLAKHLHEHIDEDFGQIFP